MRRRAAGIIVQDVQAAEAAHGLGKSGFDVAALADIAVDEDAVAAAIPAAGAGGFRRNRPGRLVDLGDDDAGALLGKALRGGAADADATAGDEGNLFASRAMGLTPVLKLFRYRV